MVGIEIIPNWHPIFVHFSIGLLSISGLFYLASLVFKKESFLIVARWNLWVGSIMTVGTVLAGLYAYYTVAHDGASHIAMMDHRNWALPTAGIFLILALWSFWKQRTAKTASAPFVLIMLFASALLAVTGYKGAEVVYRHGAGVMRLPVIQGDGGHDSHDHGAMGHGNKSIQEIKPEDGHQNSDGHNHNH